MENVNKAERIEYFFLVFFKFEFLQFHLFLVSKSGFFFFFLGRKIKCGRGEICVREGNQK